jgi:hypothetical protein
MVAACCGDVVVGGSVRKVEGKNKRPQPLENVAAA